MNKQLVATRNTCFAVISSIEDDFRAIIRTVCEATNIVEILPADVRINATKRHDTDAGGHAEMQRTTDLELLVYIDFADIAKVLDSQISKLLERERDWIKSIAQTLVSLSATRNRVCHTRPLEPEDFARTLDFAKGLVSVSAPFRFPTVSTTLDRLEKDPGFVLYLQIPPFWSSDQKAIHHNLPLPEFDETGYLGRTSDRTQVAKLLHSHYPIVTIVGEGGVGKTALALRCLYDITDDADTPYDAIVWITLKTTSLTHAGVRELSGAINSTLGLLSSIADNLGTPETSLLSQEQLIAEIVQYMSEFRILVAIDNLETLSTGSLRELVVQIPAKSKILITSRVGLGEFEARYALGGLDEKTSVTLMRTFGRVLGIVDLPRMDESVLRGYCRKLFHNPLLIKWFVASVGRGADPGKFMNRNTNDFKDALAFCFANLFQNLGESERAVVNTLACARKTLSSAEIHYLNTEMSQVQAEGALSTLHNSSIVSRVLNKGDGYGYALSESALAYLSEQSPPPKEVFLRVQNRLRELRLTLERESVAQSRYEYEIFSVRSGPSRDDRIASVYLRRALDANRRDDFPSARSEIEEAKRLTPGNSEVWRIAALVESRAGEVYRAVENYEQAIELDQKSKIARYSYSVYSLTTLDDAERALEHISRVEDLDPGHTAPLSLKARALTILGKYEIATDIYELLLEKIESIPRKWRITTVDQSAECYRRWAELDKENRDTDGSKKHCMRALDILGAAVRRNDYDDKLRERVAKLLDEALSHRESIIDNKYVERIISGAEDIVSKVPQHSIPVIEGAPRALRALADQEKLRERLLGLDSGSMNRMNIAQSSATGETTKRHQGQQLGAIMNGVVHNIPAGARYGFIEDSYGERWFFHSSFLVNRGDWKLLSPMTRVQFRIGKNEHGSCATEIRITE